MLRVLQRDIFLDDEDIKNLTGPTKEERNQIIL